MDHPRCCRCRPLPPPRSPPPPPSAPPPATHQRVHARPREVVYSAVAQTRVRCGATPSTTYLLLVGRRLLALGAGAAAGDGGGGDTAGAAAGGHTQPPHPRQRIVLVHEPCTCDERSVPETCDARSVGVRRDGGGGVMHGLRLRRGPAGGDAARPDHHAAGAEPLAGSQWPWGIRAVGRCGCSLSPTLRTWRRTEPTRLCGATRLGSVGRRSG